MTNWRNCILKKFPEGASPKSVVSDPDELLRDDVLYSDLTSRAYSVIHYTNSVEFRFTYETEFREAWDNGNEKPVVIVLPADAQDFELLPADVLAGARELSFHLKDIFPKLSYTVVSKLEKRYLDALFMAHENHAHQTMGDALTKEFVLKHVFSTVPEVINTPSDLLRLLLQRHYRKMEVPSLLDEHLIDVLRTNPTFAGWPLAAIVPDRTAFWQFLQERWPPFVDRKTAELGSGEWEEQIAAEGAILTYPGPLALPFDHHDVCVYIDNLFSEGILKPIALSKKAIEALPWLRVGTGEDSLAETRRQLVDLAEQLNSSSISADSTPGEWLQYAEQFARVQYLRNEMTVAGNQSEIPADACPAEIHQTFGEWMENRYPALFNHPAVSPLMVHHIPGYLASRLQSDRSQKVALLLVDGLALDQWLVVADVLTGQLPRISVKSSSLYAWVPTLTCISRQAAYSGKIPLYFDETVMRTDRDEAGWRRFWSDNGMIIDQVSFCAVGGDPGDMAAVDAAVTARTRAFGCTIFKVDKMMHGAVVGRAAMANQIRIWSDQSFLQEVITTLVDKGFDVVLTADHGNIEATGMGAPNEGAVPEQRGERCRIYNDPVLAKAGAEKISEAIPWTHPGLPKSMHALLAPDTRSFATKGKVTVGHGGNSLQEVIVPFIQFSRTKTEY
jgi:hypothetical protein